MTQNSMLWTTNNTGDGPTGGFTQANWVDFNRYILGRLSSATQAVLDLASGTDLLVTGTATPVSIAAGAALVYGFFYWNDATVTQAITTPAIGTTGFRIVLRASWAAQTVRIALLTSSDGVATIPAVTQTPGTTYEVSLATGTVTTGGVIALTDTRAYVHMATRIDRSQVDGGTSMRIPFNDSSGLLTDVAGFMFNSAGLQLRLQGTTAGFWIDETDGPAKGGFIGLNNGIWLFQKHATGFGAAETTPFQMDIINGQITITPASALPPLILGASGQDQRVTGLRADSKSTLRFERQGGSATDWFIAGNTNRTVTMPKMHCGVKQVPGVATTITFPSAFTQPPHVQLTVVAAAFSQLVAYVQNITTTTCVIYVYDTGTGSLATAAVQWLAIGEE